MQLKRTSIAAGTLALAGALAACGSGGSSTTATAESTPTSGAAGAPTDATQEAFCGSFQTLSSKSTPAEVAAQLEKVGTPSDIDAGARNGFEVFLGKVENLPDNAGAKALDQLQSSLSAADQKDVLAFLTYTQKECASSSTPSDGAS
ncbi:MAG TPA: hypothetical protein VFJ89_06720 [Nocardioides sp.]|jgi:hypothetical protein|nr:hypothetical protein [Nocardioides sp.]